MIAPQTRGVDTDNLSLSLQLLHEAGEEVGIGSLERRTLQAFTIETSRGQTWSLLQYWGAACKHDAGRE